LKRGLRSRCHVATDDRVSETNAFSERRIPRAVIEYFLTHPPVKEWVVGFQIEPLHVNERIVAVVRGHYDWDAQSPRCEPHGNLQTDVVHLLDENVEPIQESIQPVNLKTTLKDLNRSERVKLVYAPCRDDRFRCADIAYRTEKAVKIGDRKRVVIANPKTPPATR
jgi:hypothetical protein